jgi:7,8-dihydro-6-hydroxymethylpterin dimethyltransferase
MSLAHVMQLTRRWSSAARAAVAIPAPVGAWALIWGTEDRKRMHKPVKVLELALTFAAGGAWAIFERLNKVRPNPSFTPHWSDKPLLKSWQKEKPKLGWPRETDSLCPRCVPEMRRRILDGELPVEILQDRTIGEIKAQVIERDGQILMVKDCPIHGHFEDVMAIDTKFFGHLEKVFPGRDIRAHNDERLHKHGSSTIKYGRGSVLTIDLTNRCNMMCDPCFMDANQVGFVHELSWDDIKKLLDDAITIKPKRQMSVQFSGGEPTLSPYFLDAVAYARKVGYTSVQAATNGIEFAKSKDFCKRAAESGLRYAYLQFDGIGNAANSHRKVGNLFDVKLRAIENLYESGVDIVPVITIVNGINNEQVGRVIQFALDNPRIISLLSFQPVSFTGRDEAITDERRKAQRYTLSHLAHDVKSQTGLGEPARDWFPISFMSTFSDWADLVHGPQHEWGQLCCGCHPNCGVGFAVMIDKHTREAAPLGQFLNVDRLAEDVKKINDAGRGKFLSALGMALAVMRNYRPLKTSTHFTIFDLLKKFDKGFGVSKKARSGGYGKVTADRTLADVEKRRNDRWNILFIAGMWFQDLFNYDFRRTEQCIIPYATQQGEISFCAYNTGIGWRNIIEKMHMTATLTKWYQEHGRHEIFAGGKSVPFSGDLKLKAIKLKDEIVTTEEQHDLDELGIAKNSREEKLRARDAAAAQRIGTAQKLKEQAEYERMEKLYRQHILGEKPAPSGFVPLTTLAPSPSASSTPQAKPEQTKKEEAEPVLGD